MHFGKVVKAISVSQESNKLLKAQNLNREEKWWRHKNLTFEIMGLITISRKNSTIIHYLVVRSDEVQLYV